MLGEFIRRKREAAGLSLRAVSMAIGVSHVFLGEVERGVRKSLAESRWPALVEAVPGITIDALKERSMAQQMPQVEDAEPEYQALTLALARRINRRDVGPEEFKKLMQMLGKDEDE